MTCDYCSIDPVARYGVPTRLGHCVHLCDRCARRHGISPHRPRQKLPRARDGPDDRRSQLLPLGQT